MRIYPVATVARRWNAHFPRSGERGYRAIFNRRLAKDGWNMKRKMTPARMCLAGLAASMCLVNVLPAQTIRIAEQEWTLHRDTGDSGSLTIGKNALEIQFEATVKKEYQFGNQRVRQAVYSVVLEKPLKLTAHQTRIFFTAKGILQQYRRTADSYNLFPVIRDANGEEFYYTPYPESYLGQPAKWNIPPENWQRWRTNYFYTNEAGGATTDIFEAHGGDGYE